MSPVTEDDVVIWHDVENGSYTADLALWRELAAGADPDHGPILELGCGTGRVALELGRAGYTVRGIDTEPALVAAANERGAEPGLEVSATVGDMRQLPPAGPFSLIAAPMQVIQLLDGPDERAAALRAMARAAAPGALIAIAIVEGVEPASAATDPGFAQPLPDVGEVEGRIYSSLPLDVTIAGGRMEVRRLRQLVELDGELSDAVVELSIRELSAGELEREGRIAGLLPAGRREVAATDTHMGSTVVLLEAAP